MSLFDLRKVLPLVAVRAACATKETAKSASTSDSTAKPAAAPVAHQMTIVASDYKFDAPAEVPSGMMTIHLVDNGSEIHHVALVMLKDGKTMADVGQVLKNQAPTPAWWGGYGGMDAQHPGGGVASTPQELPVLQSTPDAAEAPPVSGIPLPVIQ